MPENLNDARGKAIGVGMLHVDVGDLPLDYDDNQFYSPILDEPKAVKRL